ncbi:MAG: HD domain-containing protein [Candidatus Aegiribacteria sp.]|nr:HD domain-containing protein [Candidatus Aegiribacteria sp.]
MNILTRNVELTMGEAFLEYLNALNSPRDLVDSVLIGFTERLSDYHSFIRNMDRDVDPMSYDIGKKLRALGAPMESYKIMKADAHHYEYRGNEKMFWLQMYLAGAFANLGYPTESIEKEAACYCEKLKSEKKNLLFLPLFLNNYAGILHIYRENYADANYVYREAVSEIRKVNPEQFESATERKYLWATKMISNNYIDSLLVTERTIKEEEELERVLSIAEEKMEETESEPARCLTLLNKAEARARRGRPEEADEILEGIIRDVSENTRGLVEPGYHRIKALVLANKGNSEKSIELMIRSLDDAGYYGNTLSETLTMRDGLHVYNILASKKGKKDLHIFFREKGLFEYLLKVLRIKDWYLGSEHTENVKKTAVGIAEVLSLNHDEIKLIGTSAQLHDIGKCAIPWYSLNKIAPLDDLDWEVIKIHPAEGARMLRKLDLEKEAEIAEDHHERIDGSGYPEGKKNISLETEIVAISDTYSAAITPNRRYRIPKMPMDVLYELKKGKIGKFSSRVIISLEKYVGERK